MKVLLGILWIFCHKRVKQTQIKVRTYSLRIRVARFQKLFLSQLVAFYVNKTMGFLDQTDLICLHLVELCRKYPLIADADGAIAGKLIPVRQFLLCKVALMAIDSLSSQKPF